MKLQTEIDHKQVPSPRPYILMWDWCAHLSWKNGKLGVWNKNCRATKTLLLEVEGNLTFGCNNKLMKSLILFLDGTKNIFTNLEAQLKKNTRSLQKKRGISDTITDSIICGEHLSNSSIRFTPHFYS